MAAAFEKNAQKLDVQLMVIHDEYQFSSCAICVFAHYRRVRERTGPWSRVKTGYGRIFPRGFTAPCPGR
jgi:hypothetical protein